MANEADKVPETMRAMVLKGYGGVEMMELRKDYPVPKVGADEVLVRVGACGINNTDINTRTRWYDRERAVELSEEVGLKGVALGTASEETTSSWNGDKVPFPLIQGAAIVGRITAVGANVDSGRIGERVILDPQVRDLSLPLRAQLVAYMGAERDGGFAEYVAAPVSNAYRRHQAIRSGPRRRETGHLRLPGNQIPLFGRGMTDGFINRLLK